MTKHCEDFATIVVVALALLVGFIIGYITSDTRDSFTPYSVQVGSSHKFNVPAQDYPDTLTIIIQKPKK